MKKNLPKISVIIPCYNEEKFIAKTISSILNQSYPKTKIEVIVVDGGSSDKTLNILKKIKQKNKIKIINNSKKIPAAAMNLGIKCSKHNIIIRLDAHSKFPQKYLENCVNLLLESGADNVGGFFQNMSSANSIISDSIAVAMSSTFGVGNSAHRINGDKEVYQQSVPYGCFHKMTFDKFGLFNENLPVAEDYEFNSRIIKNGGKNILSPKIKIKYFCRQNYFQLFKQMFRYGFYKTQAVFRYNAICSVGHFLPLLFFSSIVLFAIFPICNYKFLFSFLVLYFLLSFLFSVYLAAKEKKILLIFIQPITFFIIHFSHGFGQFVGIVFLFFSYYFFKRLLDFFLAIFSFILFLPLIIILTILIKIDSPGPVFFCQERLGKNGKKFKIIKLRTMVQGAEKSKPILAVKDDPRLTKIGKFLRNTYFDELPQLLQIINGEMSFIGPRPEREYFHQKFSKKIANWPERLEIKPGITGLAQIHEKSSSSPAEKLKFDLKYIKSVSFLLDFLIFLSTINILFFAFFKFIKIFFRKKF